MNIISDPTIFKRILTPKLDGALGSHLLEIVKQNNLKIKIIAEGCCVSTNCLDLALFDKEPKNPSDLIAYMNVRNFIDFYTQHVEEVQPKGKKISECGDYAMVRCAVGVDGFITDRIYFTGDNGEGVYLIRNPDGEDIHVYESAARFVEHVEEVQLAEPVVLKRSVYDDLIEAGWTHENLIANGYIPARADEIDGVELSYREHVEELPNPSPWDGQVGGTHYTDKAVQPLKLTLLNRGYEAFSGACYTKINKYTTRAKDNEVEQLKKARHVLDLWIHEAEMQNDES